MSRRRRDVEFQHVVLDVVCHNGHRVGAVVKMIRPHPRAGQYATAGGVRFEDRPNADENSGRVRGRCPECSDDVQVAWARARAGLDAGESEGRHTGEISP